VWRYTRVEYLAEGSITNTNMEWLCMVRCRPFLYASQTEQLNSKVLYT
jgi:hypothetical protein